jgi:GT2 family glycosyltransferase
MSPRAADATPPEASVIVITHNNESLVARCLRSITAGVRLHSYEVILVDNCSTDGTLAAIPDDAKPHQVIALESNVGYAAANNVGIGASRGRVIVLLNSDAFPDRESIDTLIQAIDELPRAGIIGARLRYPSGKPQPSVGRFPSLTGGLWMALMLHRLPLSARLGIGISTHPTQYRSRRKVDWVTGAFCIARREVGEMPAGAFMYGEDVAWALASRQAGWEIWFDPAATAIHIGRASVDQSQDPGFAQRRRVEFELGWFAERGRLARLAARGVLVLHALVRLLLYGGLRAVRGSRDRRIGENLALLRAALSTRRLRL